jgi:hypothetical protein
MASPVSAAAAAPRTQEEIERLRCGDEDFRRSADHLPAFFPWCVSAPRLHMDPGERDPCPGEMIPQLPQGLKKVMLDVIVQGLERRDIEHSHLSLGPCAYDELIQTPQKSREGLAASRGCSPSTCLPCTISAKSLSDFGGRPHFFRKPLLDEG